MLPVKGGDNWIGISNQGILGLVWVSPFVHEAIIVISVGTGVGPDQPDSEIDFYIPVKLK